MSSTTYRAVNILFVQRYVSSYFDYHRAILLCWSLTIESPLSSHGERDEATFDTVVLKLVRQ